MSKQITLPTNGRKKGCGACGMSESFELMQLQTAKPYDTGIIDIKVKDKK